MQRSAGRRAVPGRLPGTVARGLTLLTAVVLIGAASAGCGNSSGGASGNARSEGSGSGASGGTASGGASRARAKAVQFSACMRSHGIAGFPDPDSSGVLTVDAVANEGGIDTSGPAWTQAYDACKSLEPSGFTGHARTAQQQAFALKFAQCMRDHGIKDFPDPTRDSPLIDTNRIPSAAGRGARDIPGFDDAAAACGKVYAADAGVRVP